MKASMKNLLTAACAAGLVSFSASALAVTKPKALNGSAAGMHCVNSRNQEIKAATRMSECKAPYHWIKAPTVAQKVKAKTKAALARANKKTKGRVATTKKTIDR